MSCRSRIHVLSCSCHGVEITWMRFVGICIDAIAAHLSARQSASVCWSACHTIDILFKNRNAYFFWCFILDVKCCMVVYFNTTYTACHSTQFLTNSSVQILPWLSMSPDLIPNKHTQNELERHVWGRVSTHPNVLECLKQLTQSERPCNYAWVVSGR